MVGVVTYWEGGYLEVCPTCVVIVVMGGAVGVWWWVGVRGGL